MKVSGIRLFLFVCSVFLVSYLCPANPTPAPTSHLLLRGPGARRGKFGKWRTKEAGKADPCQTGRAGVPGRGKPAPLLPAAAEGGTVGKREQCIIRLWEPEAAAVPAARPPLPPAPLAPARPLRGQQVAKGSGDRTPRTPPHPASSGGNWEPASHSSFPFPPKEAQAVIPLKLLYFLSLYTHTYKNIHALYIYSYIFCIMYRIRLATMIPSTT